MKRALRSRRGREGAPTAVCGMPWGSITAGEFLEHAGQSCDTRDSPFSYEIQNFRRRHLRLSCRSGSAASRSPTTPVSPALPSSAQMASACIRRAILRLPRSIRGARPSRPCLGVSMVAQSLLNGIHVKVLTLLILLHLCSDHQSVPGAPSSAAAIPALYIGANRFVPLRVNGAASTVVATARGQRAGLIIERVPFGFIVWFVCPRLECTFIFQSWRC